MGPVPYSLHFVGNPTKVADTWKAHCRTSSRLVWNFWLYNWLVNMYYENAAVNWNPIQGWQDFLWITCGLERLCITSISKSQRWAIMVLNSKLIWTMDSLVGLWSSTVLYLKLLSPVIWVAYAFAAVPLMSMLLTVHHASIPEEKSWVEMHCHLFHLMCVRS